MQRLQPKRTRSNLITLIILLSALLLVAACVAPTEPSGLAEVNATVEAAGEEADDALEAAGEESEIADEADVSEEEAAALAATEGEGEDAVDEAEEVAEEAADVAEKAVEEAADALEASLRNFEELDADATEAEVDQAFTEFEAASEELLAIAAAEGGDVDGLEQALDEMEMEMRESVDKGEPIEASMDFLSDFYSDFFN